ncbi:MAG: hypothetical protein ACP5TL_01000 [Candidatus Micrarchaeia archaeon]
MEKNIELYTVFHTKAKLKTSLFEVKRKIEQLPNVSRIFEGSKIMYSLKGTAGLAYIEFGKSEIYYKFYFDAPSIAIYNKNLLAFIAILNLLKEDYEVLLESIYAFIVHALSQSSNRQGKENFCDTCSIKMRSRSLNLINYSISKELVKLMEKQKQIEDENRIMIGIIRGRIELERVNGSQEFIDQIKEDKEARAIVPKILLP